jgi:orotate phosphoribosyltransferase
MRTRSTLPAGRCSVVGGPGRRHLGSLSAVTTTEQTPKDRLAELIKELAIVHGTVTLSSGREADYYVDMRRLTLHHEAAPLIGHLMLDLLEESGMGVGEIDAVGGPTMGADPVVCAIQHAAASRGLDLDAFLVRKEAKGHGMKRQVEGPDIEGRKVVVVEDTTTTGGSPMLAVEAARAVGAEVLGVATILDRETEATEVFARADLPYVSLLSSSDLGLGRQ